MDAVSRPSAMAFTGGVSPSFSSFMGILMEFSSQFHEMLLNTTFFVQALLSSGMIRGCALFVSSTICLYVFVIPLVYFPRIMHRLCFIVRILASLLENTLTRFLQFYLPRQQQEHCLLDCYLFNETTKQFGASRWFLFLRQHSFQERDNMQKTEFLKALSDMWKDFDSRVLRYKVCSILQFILSIFFQPILLTHLMCTMS